MIVKPFGIYGTYHLLGHYYDHHHQLGHHDHHHQLGHHDHWHSGSDQIRRDQLSSAIVVFGSQQFFTEAGVNFIELESTFQTQA